MELLILDITFHTSNKIKVNGFNLTTKGLDNMIQETSKRIVLVDKVGGDNLKVHIF